LRCMIETPFRLCLGGSPEPVTIGLGLFYALPSPPRLKLGMSQAIGSKHGPAGIDRTGAGWWASTSAVHLRRPQGAVTIMDAPMQVSGAGQQLVGCEPQAVMKADRLGIDQLG